MPVTSLKNWFPLKVVRDKRSEIAQKIRELAAKFNNKKLVFPQIEFTSKPGFGSGYSDVDDNNGSEMEEDYDEQLKMDGNDKGDDGGFKLFENPFKVSTPRLNESNRCLTFTNPKSDSASTTTLAAYVPRVLVLNV